MSTTPPTTGEFPLTGVSGLPLIDIAFRGEMWSDVLASGVITPGSAVVPVLNQGQRYVRTATDADTALIPQLGIAMQPPTGLHDSNTGPTSMGPNQVRNQPILPGKYVLMGMSGVYHTTLIRPDTYRPFDLIGWDADGARPAGIAGTGSWAKNGTADLDSIFEVQEFRPYGNVSGEGLLTIRSLRGQFH